MGRKMINVVCPSCGKSRVIKLYDTTNKNYTGLCTKCNCFNMGKRNTVSAQKRFWDKVDKIENGCWLWNGEIELNGYGRIRINHKNELAHRVAYEWLKGNIPDNLHIDHLCRNRACVNPDHMEIVTCQINILRGFGTAAINARKTHCPQGHPYDLFNTYRNTRGDRVCKICAKQRRIKYLNKRKVLCDTV